MSCFGVMTMRAFSNRAVAVATATAIVLSVSGVPAFAASKPEKNVQTQALATDLSAAKRYRGRRGIDPAGRAFLGIAGMMAGAIAANIAADRYRERYYQPYGYYGYGPYPYRPGPYYYGYPY
jgi:hypothetical protein